MNEKLAEYLTYFLKQKEAGLIIIENENQLEEAKNQIGETDFAVTSLWQEVIDNFKNQKSVCLVLAENFSKEQYDLIAQYFARSGFIQIMDKKTMKLISIQFDSFKCHLLLLTSQNVLSEIEKNYSLKDKVGLIERI